MSFEYKVVPAPTRGRKARGVKTTADRFALALETTLNDLAAEGWEYQRTETLPAEERHGLAKRSTVEQNMLIFRRPVATEEAARPDPDISDKPSTDAPTPPAPQSRNTLSTMIEHEISAARAPRLPSAEAAQETPEAPAKAPTAPKAPDIYRDQPDQTGTDG